jgi:Zn-finger nucleic acid-binding protein
MNQVQMGEMEIDVCSVALNPQRLDHALTVIVDACLAGHGVWLDKGEFPAVRVFFREAFERIAKHQNQSLQEIEDAAKPVEKPVDPDILLGKLLCATVQADAGYVHDVMDINKTMVYLGADGYTDVKPGSEAYDIKYNISHVKKKPFKWSS